jgi:hypothetical protein
LAQPDFLIPFLDQQSPFADWTVSPRCIPVNRGFSVSAIGYKTGFNINSPATGDYFQVDQRDIPLSPLDVSEVTPI